MNYLVAIIASILLMGGSFYAGRVSAPSEHIFGAAEAAKQALLKKNVEVETRLKQPIEWDVSVATAKEITAAITEVASLYSVSNQDILDAGGNVQAAIQVKMGEQSKLCSNPNSNTL